MKVERKIVHVIKSAFLFLLLAVVSDDFINVEANTINYQDPLINVRNNFLKVIKEIPETKYIKASSFFGLPGEVCMVSHQWLSIIFSRGHGPQYDSNKAEHWYHPAVKGNIDFDILLHKYQIKTMHVRVFESSNMVFILVTDFEKITADKANGGKKSEIIASELLNRPDVFRFTQMEIENREIVSSTHSERPFSQINNWWERIDCFEKSNEIGYFIFKISISLPDVPSPQSWFPQEMRN
jgi:hypothetical protein